ncbi:MAG TPA: NAD-dependent epimerase/dehydratase family protein, partial [bacterium]|nr:NAD-dependent epimerase/dehydratase family protein [bacterium]
MRILISGSSGLIGSALCVALAEQGHEIIRLVRSKEADGVYWNPDSLEIDASGLENIQAVIHLAGKNVASERWTESVKREIRDSRVRGTRLLAGTLAQMQTPPKVLITASAIGYYGDRGDEILTEDSPAGTGFLAEVCEEWERAVEPAREKGIR